MESEYCIKTCTSSNFTFFSSFSRSVAFCHLIINNHDDDDDDDEWALDIIRLIISKAHYTSPSLSCTCKLCFSFFLLFNSDTFIYKRFIFLLLSCFSNSARCSSHHFLLPYLLTVAGDCLVASDLQPSSERTL